MSGEVAIIEPLRSGGQLAAIIPQTFEDVQRLAKVAVKAGLYKADDDETALAQACMAIMQGLECGVPPTQAVQQIAVINGRCVIWGDLVPALVWAKGHKIKEWMEGEGDARTAFCEITRGDNGQVIRRSFSVAEAKAARLWDTREKIRRKNAKGEWYDRENDSPWFRFPTRMLQMRARGFAVRDGVPDVLRGMYVREEMEEREPIDITPEPTPIQAKQQAVIPDVPDIPDIDSGAADQEAILAEIEAKIEQGGDPAAIHAEYASVIINMDDESRDRFIEMIEAAKAPVQQAAE